MLSSHVHRPELRCAGSVNLGIAAAMFTTLNSMRISHRLRWFIITTLSYENEFENPVAPLRRAFTLIELLVVIAIIAILAGMLAGAVAPKASSENQMRFKPPTGFAPCISMTPMDFRRTTALITLLFLVWEKGIQAAVTQPAHAQSHIVKTGAVATNEGGRPPSVSDDNGAKGAYGSICAAGLDQDGSSHLQLAPQQRWEERAVWQEEPEVRNPAGWSWPTIFLQLLLRVRHLGPKTFQLMDWHDKQRLGCQRALCRLHVGYHQATTDKPDSSAGLANFRVWID